MNMKNVFLIFSRHKLKKTREKFLMLTRNFIDFNFSVVISSTYFNGAKLKKLFSSWKVKREIKKIMKNSIRNPEYLAMIWKSSIFYQTLSHRIMWSRIFDIKTYLFKQMLFDFSFYSESILVQSVRQKQVVHASSIFITQPCFS